VVWQGSVGDRRPYVDLTALSAVFQSLLHELGKPFLTENTVLKVLQFLILKCFATGCNLEQTFGQDVPSDLGGLKGRHSGATLLKGHY